MSFRWKRTVKTREVLAVIRVEFRPELSDLISLLARYALDKTYADEREPEEPLELDAPSDTAFFKYVREQYWISGDSAPAYWDEELHDHEKAPLYEWAHRAAVDMWPAFADDISKIN
jgi:hypothetical protein